MTKPTDHKEKRRRVLGGAFWLCGVFALLAMATCEVKAGSLREYKECVGYVTTHDAGDIETVCEPMLPVSKHKLNEQYIRCIETKPGFPTEDMIRACALILQP